MSVPMIDSMPISRASTSESQCAGNALVTSSARALPQDHMALSVDGADSRVLLWLGSVAALGLLFQIGHFAEHAIQFTVWLLGDLSNICGRDTPWMSLWATELVRNIGLWLFPTAGAGRRMMLGMETLHLIGNSIFLTSLACLYYCVRSKWVKWALLVETFHLYELFRREADRVEYALRRLGRHRESRIRRRLSR